LYDPNGILQPPSRTDVKIYKIEGVKLAAEMGNPKVFNMIVLGAFLKIKPIVKMENVIAGLKKSLHERYHKLIPLNEEAITVGMNNIKTV
jgi:2-oxoglutarate ferredoxin oxidoreductase subunit gamma